MTEADLWRLIDRAGAALGDWHGQRHEDRFAPDIPDASFTSGGRSGWFELKCSTTSHKKPTKIPKLRPGQLNWLAAEARCGGRAWIVWRARDTILFIWPLSLTSFDEARTMADWLSAADVVCDPTPEAMRMALRTLSLAR